MLYNVIILKHVSYLHNASSGNLKNVRERCTYDIQVLAYNATDTVQVSKPIKNKIFFDTVFSVHFDYTIHS